MKEQEEMCERNERSSSIIDLDDLWPQSNENNFCEQNVYQNLNTKIKVCMIKQFNSRPRYNALL